MAKDNPGSAGDGSRESSLASGWTVEGETEARPEPIEPAGGAGAPGDDEAVEPSPGQLSNGALVLLGLIGGLYLLYTIVWFSWANYYSAVNSAVAEGSGSLGGVLQQLVFWIAPLAPVLWFAATWVLTRGTATWIRIVALIGGAVLLVPWPFVMFGTVGA